MATRPEHRHGCHYYKQHLWATLPRGPHPQPSSMSLSMLSPAPAGSLQIQERRTCWP